MNVPTSKTTRNLAVLAAALLTAGCVSHSHVVGLGATGTGATSAKQYYFLFGLVPLNTIDTQRLAPDLTSYTIETGFGFGDFLLAPLLLVLTMTSRTVVVRT